MGTESSNDLRDRLRALGSHLDDEIAEVDRPGRTTRPSNTWRERRLSVPSIAVAAALVLVAAIVLTSFLGDDRSTSLDTAATTTGSSVSPSDTAVPSADPDESDRTDTGLDLGPVPRMEDVLAGAPPLVDLDAGPLIHPDFAGAEPEEVARSYFDDRLPDAVVALAMVEVLSADDVTMVLFRWGIARQDDPTEPSALGSLLVRVDDPFTSGVVLATSDAISVDSVERTVERVGAAATGDDTTSDGSVELAADVMTLAGQPVSALPVPGSAGITAEHRIDVDVEVGPIPVVIRFQQIESGSVSISEFAVDAVGFAEGCGAGPPVTIDVGELLAPLEPGPSPHVGGRGLINQEVWHHPSVPNGPDASIEISWPADPALVARLGPDGFGDGRSVSFGPPPGIDAGESVDASEQAANDVLLLLDGEPDGPCSVVQISVAGQQSPVDWWSTALSGEWAFELPLTIADLDPADELGGETGSPTTGELVVATERVERLPVVPPTGSCDGLPDAPPQSGQGVGLHTGTPRGALADFLANAEPREFEFPSGGYTELELGETSISYLIGTVDRPNVVINTELTDEGWTVVDWTTSAC